MVNKWLIFMPVPVHFYKFDAGIDWKGNSNQRVQTLESRVPGSWN